MAQRQVGTRMWPFREVLSRRKIMLLKEPKPFLMSREQTSLRRSLRAFFGRHGAERSYLNKGVLLSLLYRCHSGVFKGMT